MDTPSDGIPLGVSHLVTTPSPELGHPPVCAVRMPYRITAIIAFRIVQDYSHNAVLTSPDHDVAHDSSSVLRDRQATGFAQLSS